MSSGPPGGAPARPPAAEARVAELIVTGRVATLAGDLGFGWQPGMAVAGGRVLAVGPEHELEPLAGPRTRRWRLPDEHVVVPGITDAHLHLMTLALAEMQIDLTGLNLPATLAAIGARHAALGEAGDHSGWLLGHGWSLHGFGGWPDAALLETVAPGRPVALYAHDHHTRWLSATALRLAGISASSGDPGGGMIRRAATGAPTGILHETAAAMVDPVIPDPSADELIDTLARVAARLAALGITGCHDPGELNDDPLIARGPLFYRSLAARGLLPLRVHASLRAAQLARAIELGLHSGQKTVPETDAYDPRARRQADRYTLGWLKLFADGSLGSRSAALLAPYADAATNPPTGGPRGMFLTAAEELAELLARAAGAGIVGQVHAIGDAAVRVALDALESAPTAAGQGGAATGLMPRIEHAQLIDPADIARFGRLGIAASVQPVHLRSDAAQVRLAWAERHEYAFPLAALVAGGALIPFGSDAPVEPPDPWPGLAVAVARRDPGAPTDAPLGAQHALDPARALRAACLDPALVAGEPIGRLLPGFRADLLIVPGASFSGSADAAALAAVRPLATLIDGEVVYRTDDFQH